MWSVWHDFQQFLDIFLDNFAKLILILNHLEVVLQLRLHDPHKVTIMTDNDQLHRSIPALLNQPQKLLCQQHDMLSIQVSCGLVQGQDLTAWSKDLHEGYSDDDWCKHPLTAWRLPSHFHLLSLSGHHHLVFLLPHLELLGFMVETLDLDAFNVLSMIDGLPDVVDDRVHLSQLLLMALPHCLLEGPDYVL